MFKTLLVSLPALVALVHGAIYQGEERQYLLDLHNEYRRNKVPMAASNMRKLEWDDYLAKEANDLVLECGFDHRTNGYGQNLFGTGKGDGGKKTIEDALNSWGWESLQREPPNADGTGANSHAAQIYSAVTYKVGCAWQTCGDGWTHVFCNYNPTGYLGTPWFVPGPSCSACPSDASSCEDKLCVSGDQRAEPAPTEPTPTEPTPTEPTPTDPTPTEPTEPAPAEPVPAEPAPTEAAPPSEDLIALPPVISDPPAYNNPSVDPSVEPTSTPKLRRHPRRRHRHHSHKSRYYTNQE
jgi:hypothetical protein